MKKKFMALICVIAMLMGMFSTIASAATTAAKLIPTSIPKSFPLVKQDPSSTTINFWHAMTSANGSVVNNVVNWFNATEGKAKKIYVKCIFQGNYDDITLKVQATLQSKNIKDLPDLIQLSSGGSFALKEAPELICMEDMIKTDTSSKIMNKLNKNAIWACSYKGKQMGMPFSNSVIILHYNATAFKAVGLDPDSPPKTMADFAVAAEKLVIKGKTGKPSRYGASGKPYQYHLSTWVPRQKGGTASQFDMEEGRMGTPKKLVCATDGTLKAAITAWTKACSTGAVNYTNGSATAYYTGLSTMCMASMVGYEACLISQNGRKAENRFEPRMARLPVVNANDTVGEAIGGSAVYMLNRGDEVKKLATWQFVKFLASVDASAYWYSQTGYFPLNGDALNTKYVQDILKERPEKKVPLQILAESVKYYKFQEPSIPSNTVYSDCVADQMALAAQGKQSVDQAVSAIEKKAASILKVWWDMNS